MNDILLTLAMVLALTGSLFGQPVQTPTTVAAPTNKTIEVNLSPAWTDAGVDLHAGDLVEISAETSGDKTTSSCDPQGVVDLANAGKLPLDSASPAALLAKLQEKSDVPLFVGAARNLKITATGHLYFAPNLGSSGACSGNYTVKIRVTSGGANQVVSITSKLASAAQIFMSGQFGDREAPDAQNQSIASDAKVTSTAPVSQSKDTTRALAAKTLAISRTPIDQNLATDLQSLPRRVNDEFKHPGDMVNFILIGSEKQVKDALTAANWHVADTSTPGALARAILMATQKQDYLQMPMSQLYLFGRVQDFGYEQAEPYAMVASRHHFRIWKSTLSYKGLPIWAGAGTHDIGFEKDQRNGKVTHKIDPLVDGERDHIGESLQQAGIIRMMQYFAPSDLVRDARNATGGGYQSDGRVLVMFLQ